MTTQPWQQNGYTYGQTPKLALALGGQAGTGPGATPPPGAATPGPVAGATTPNPTTAPAAGPPGLTAPTQYDWRSDPSYLALVNSLNLQGAQATDTTRAAEDEARQQLGQLLPQYQHGYEVQQGGIKGQMLSRGILGSSETEDSLAQAGYDQNARVAAAQQAEAFRESDLERGLAQQQATIGGQKEQASADAQQKAYADFTQRKANYDNTVLQWQMQQQYAQQQAAAQAAQQQQMQQWIADQQAQMAAYDRQLAALQTGQQAPPAAPAPVAPPADAPPMVFPGAVPVGYTSPAQNVAEQVPVPAQIPGYYDKTRFGRAS